METKKNIDFGNTDTDIREEILNLALLIAIIGCLVSGFINQMSGSPFSQVLIPILSAVFTMALYYLSKVKNKCYFSKIVFLLFINVVAIPAIWLYSTVPESAMPYYTCLIFIVTVILIEKKWELIIPVYTVVQLVSLLQFQILIPRLFPQYGYELNGDFITSIHYVIVSIIIFVVLQTLIRIHKSKHDMLYDLSVTDQLTGLYNRRFLIESIAMQHNKSERTGEPFTILMIDINNFKDVNDTYGHIEGDHVLQELGLILNGNSRNYDICGRYGGDEFMVILPDTYYDAASIFAERINRRFCEHTSKFADLNISLSIGISENEDMSIEEIIAHADDCLYDKKSVDKSDTSL